MQQHPMALTMAPAPLEPPAPLMYQPTHTRHGPPLQQPAPPPPGTTNGGVLWGPCQAGTIPGQYSPAVGPTQWNPPSPGAQASGGAASWGAAGGMGGDGYGFASEPASPMRAPLARGPGPMPGLLSASRSQPDSPTGQLQRELPPAGKIFPREMDPAGRAPGAYSGSAITGQLGIAATGLAPQRSDLRRHARTVPIMPSKPIPPAELPHARAFMEGATRNMDAVHSAHNGYTGAHTAKDGINAFEGTYGQRHAGKPTMSVVSLKHPPNQTSPGASGPRVTAPWETDQPARRQGLGYAESDAKVDHLMNASAGLTGAFPDPPKGRAVCDAGANARRNITMEAKGLTGVQDAGAQHHNGVHSGLNTTSKLVSGPGGLTERGRAPHGPSKGIVDSTLKVGQLGGFPMGIHQVGQPVRRPIQHAGKITASNMVHDNSGISMMARTKRPPVDHVPAGHGADMPWQGGVNDTYHHLQEQKQTLARNNGHAPAPMW